MFETIPGGTQDDDLTASLNAILRAPTVTSIQSLDQQKNSGNAIEQFRKCDVFTITSATRRTPWNC